MGKIYFTCSFDDGHITDLRLAELLRKYNLKGTFYIPRTCNLFSHSLSESNIREVSELVEIGGHTLSHQRLTNLTLQRAQAEIAYCKTWLEDVIGKAVNAFCPPDGRFNSQHIAGQLQSGFTSMRTTEMLSHSFQKIKKIGDFVILPTSCQVYNHTSMAYLRNNTKRLKFLNYRSFRKLFDSNWEIMSRNYVRYLYEIAEQKNSTYYFHLWGHSWEINQFSLWHSLERFFKSISEIDGIEFTTNEELAHMVRCGNLAAGSAINYSVFNTEKSSS